MFTKQQIYNIIESRLKTCPNRMEGTFKYTADDIFSSKYLTRDPRGE